MKYEGAGREVKPIGLDVVILIYRYCIKTTLVIIYAISYIQPEYIFDEHDEIQLHIVLVMYSLPK